MRVNEVSPHPTIIGRYGYLFLTPTRAREDTQSHETETH
jgi:hypothetical protein